MEEKTWRRGQKADYTDRPLTEVEKIFAADEKNYNQLFIFMRNNRLDTEEWYDILIIPYLNAVKKYCNRKELQIYPFYAISNKVLSCAYYNYCRAMHTQKRMPEGGLVSLDYTMEGDSLFSEQNIISEWWIDKKVNVEKQVISKETMFEFWDNIDSFLGHEQMKAVLYMLLKGYSRREIIRYICKKFNNSEWAIDGADWNFIMRQLRHAYYEIYGKRI